MQNIIVIGAGYMGSAITFPLADNRNKVNLLGTWLDNSIIESSLKGYHPKLKKSLPENVKVYYWENIRAAIKNSEIIFIGVASEGFVNVFKILLDNLNPDKEYYFFKLTKGLVEYNNKITRPTEAAYDMFIKKFSNKNFHFTSIGGPVRAIDLSNRIPSASMYGISDDSVRTLIPDFSTDYYRIFYNNDLKGVEICSTLKNIYAIATGICDGVYKRKNIGVYHNLIAFLFNQAILEMSKIIEILGCNKEIVYNLAGIGDLHVTSVAGRNRRYGEMIGEGIDGKEAFNQMYSEGEYVEGYMALKLLIPWLNNLDNESVGEDFIIDKLPLLASLRNMIFGKCDPEIELKKLILKLEF